MYFNLHFDLTLALSANNDIQKRKRKKYSRNRQILYDPRAMNVGYLKKEPG